MDTRPMNPEQWLSTEFDLSFVDKRPVKIKGRMGGETKGMLEVEKSDDGKVVVSASYDSSPFTNSVALEKFYLTQEQLNDFCSNGANCVLSAPRRSI